MPACPHPVSTTRPCVVSKHQRLVFRYGVLDQAIRGLHFSAHAPITLRILPRNRTGEPRAGEDVRALGVLDESPSCGFVRSSNRNHRVALALGGRPTVEDPLGDVYDGQRGRILLHHLATQGQQTSHVVVVVVCENHFLHVGEIDFQIAGVL